MSKQQGKLSDLKSIICRYCNEKITGDRDFRCYHFFMYHPDKIRELVKLKIERDRLNIDRVNIDHMFKSFSREMQLIYERERKLI